MARSAGIVGGAAGRVAAPDNERGAHCAPDGKLRGAFGDILDAAPVSAISTASAALAIPITLPVFLTDHPAALNPSRQNIATDFSIPAMPVSNVPQAAKPVRALRILGIDPGLRATGFGVIEKIGSRLSYVASGCIRTDAAVSLPERLGTIHAGVRELVAQYRPDQSVVEIVFVNVNPQSTLLLGQARGAAIAALVAGGVEVSEYTALQVKQAVVGHGKAAKGQVQHMVRRLLALPGAPGPDAADALACALAHAHGGQGLGAAGALAGRKLRVRNGRIVPEN